MTDDSAVAALQAIRGWLALEPAGLLRRCVQTPFQGPGPGGQKRNRVYSGVRLSHSESGLVAEASESREARRNLEGALHRLRLALALSLPLSAPRDPSPPESLAPPESTQAAAPGSARNTVPSAVSPSMETRPDPVRPEAVRPRIRVEANPRHADFPRFVLEALAALDAAEGGLSRAGSNLGVTSSALTRFLRSEKAVWAKAQEIRKRHGLHPLKNG
jgi:hypothetical protein